MQNLHVLACAQKSQRLLRNAEGPSAIYCCLMVSETYPVFQDTFLENRPGTLGNMNEDEGVVNNDASEAARTDEPAIAPGPSSRIPKRRKSDPFERDVLKIMQANVGQDADEMFLLSKIPYIKK
ncbi:hypothetical protein AVEN_85722-1 [Araneus ventricosus]|uniref:BESS domain-containing protein n=1 Tax=Araneus ventricosus TaxID=182803 RepID=A0A4Y2N5Z9_ARAVE|nr:hypothetical protein AVEN_85722-1 [Araneus ventricosus]